MDTGSVRNLRVFDKAPLAGSGGSRLIAVSPAQPNYRGWIRTLCGPSADDVCQSEERGEVRDRTRISVERWRGRRKEMERLGENLGRESSSSRMLAGSSASPVHTTVCETAGRFGTHVPPEFWLNEAAVIPGVEESHRWILLQRGTSRSVLRRSGSISPSLLDHRRWRERPVWNRRCPVRAGSFPLYAVETVRLEWLSWRTVRKIGRDEWMRRLGVW